MWTMTQGHEPHGDGGGREELLIRACGISYGYHRTDSVLPPRLLLSRHAAAIAPLRLQSASLLPTENRVKVGIQTELGVKFTWESIFFFFILSSRPVWEPWGITRHKLTINEFFNSFIKAEFTPVVLSHTTFSPPNASALGHPASCGLRLTDECMLKILHYYLTKPFEFQQRP